MWLERHGIFIYSNIHYKSQVFIMAQKNNDHLFEIGPNEAQVGTEILDANMPSNIDFDENQKQAIEMVEMNSSKIKKAEAVVHPIDFQAFNIKSYMIKGSVLINLQAQFSIDSMIPEKLSTFSVKCFDEEYTSGLKKIWESIVGFTQRQIYIHKGYIYLLASQHSGYRVVKIYKMKSLFKVFIDLEDARIRLVLKQDNIEHLVSKDYESQQIKEFLQKLSEEMDSIGLKLI